MSKIQKVVRDIENLQDFYKRTKLLRAQIKKKGLGRKKIEHAGPNRHANGSDIDLYAAGFKKRMQE